MDNSELFVTSLLFDKVRLKPSQLANNYRDILYTKLKDKVEGICTKHGYIKPDSLDKATLKVSPGKVRSFSLNGDVVFDVQYKAEVCNPPIGAVIKSKVMNTNRFGILVSSGISLMKDDGEVEIVPVIETVITKQGVGINGNVDLDKIKIGEEINVEILGKKFQLNDKKICAVGRVVENVKKVGGSKLDTGIEEFEGENDDTTSDNQGSDEEDEVADVDEKEEEKEEDVFDGEDDEESGEDDDDDTGFGSDLEDAIDEEDDIDAALSDDDLSLYDGDDD